MTELTDLSETDLSNSSISGANIAEGCAPAGINDAIRGLAGLIRRAFKTSIFRVRDATDQTKLLALDLSGLTTATTRTITMGDANVTLRPQAWELISSTSFSNDSSWNVTGLSAYRDLRIRAYLLPSTDGTELRLRTSSNNGSSYDAGANDYSWYRIYGLADTPASDGDVADTEINIGGTATVGGGSGEGVHLTLEVFNFNASALSRFLCTADALGATGAHVVTVTGALRVSSTARDAFSVYFASGSIASGYAVLEGIRG